LSVNRVNVVYNTHVFEMDLSLKHLHERGRRAKAWTGKGEVGVK
jgi:hypothetical protein